MKKNLIILVLLVVSILFAGCTAKPAADDVITDEIDMYVVSPSGVPTISLLKMAKEKPVFGEKVTVKYESLKSTDLLMSKVMKSEADAAVVPTNLASILFNKGIDYKLVSTNVWGILYLVSNTDIDNFEQLKGKEIGMIGRGLTPDIILKYLLKKNGIDPDTDLTLKYFSGASELATNFISGQVDIALMPEPMLTTALSKREDAKVVMDLQEEWKEAVGSEYSIPQASLIIKGSIIDNHPKFVEKFVAEYEASVKWLNENPAKAGEYGEELKIGLPAKVVENALPRCNVKFVAANDAKDAVNHYLEVIKEFNAKLIGGKLPDENFYYQR